MESQAREIRYEMRSAIAGPSTAAAAAAAAKAIFLDGAADLWLLLGPTSHGLSTTHCVGSLYYRMGWYSVGQQKCGSLGLVKRPDRCTSQMPTSDTGNSLERQNQGSKKPSFYLPYALAALDRLYKKLSYRKETVRLLHNIEIRVLH